jgi:sporulation integral membrane protein YlbJ
MLTLTILLFSLIIFTVFKKKISPRRPGSQQVAQTFFVLGALTLVLGMITQPKIVYQGASTGLNLWWNIVFPSLFPFFVVSEILLGLGIVNFMGVLLEPIMRPLFNVPGTGSFVLAVGYTSGYPIGAMATARLRSQRLCTRIEAERLVAFTNNSSPLFMLAAVPVGMFNNPQLGPVIAIAHYTANLTLGLLLRFYGQNDPEIVNFPLPQESLFKRAFAEMFAVYQKERRALGKILSDAVKNAMQNLFNIGGFIILFAVLIQLLTAAGFINLLAQKLSILLIPLGFSEAILPALASGLIEMTIGAKLASEAAVPLQEQVLTVSIILAWSGLSIHAQAASMLAETDIRMLPFILTRTAHAVLAAIYTYVLFNLSSPISSALAAPELNNLYQSISLWPGLPLSLALFCLITGIMLLLAIIFHFSTSFRLILFRIH